MEIRINHLNVGYGQRKIINNFSATLREKEILCLIGPNGSGKSTLLKALIGILPYQSGEIFLDGRELQTCKPKEVSQKIALLPQIHHAPGDFTVRELVSYGRMPHQKMFRPDSSSDHDIVTHAMERTRTLVFADRHIKELSGGELQRVWLACSLAQQPRILFLDEPTTYLDICHQLEMIELVQKLCYEDGLGVVLVLHDLSQALDMSDRVIVLRNGEKYAEGPPDEVIEPEMLREVYGVGCRLVPVQDRRRPVISFDRVCHLVEEQKNQAERQNQAETTLLK